MVRGVPELLLAHDDAPQEAVRLMLLGEGDAAEDLQRAVRDLARGAGHVGLRDRRGPLGVGQLVVERGGGVEHRRPGARAAHVHVGQDVAQRLVGADRAAELAALGGVVARVLEHALGRADGLRRGEQRADRGEPGDVGVDRLDAVERHGEQRDADVERGRRLDRRGGRPRRARRVRRRRPRSDRPRRRARRAPRAARSPRAPHGTRRRSAAPRCRGTARRPGARRAGGPRGTARRRRARRRRSPAGRVHSRARCSGVAVCAVSAGSQSRSRSVVSDSLSSVCSSVSSRSMAYSWGSARMRSAMMLRWICCVPP